MATVGGLILAGGATAAGAAAVGTMAVIGGVATAGSLYSSRKARKQQQRAMDIQNKQRKLSSARDAVQSVRAAQMARANIIQSGENQSVGGSSGVLGGAGSAVSQSGGNIGFANQIYGMQQSASRLMQSANMWQGRASGISQLGSLGMQFAGMGGFNGTPETPSPSNPSTTWS